MGLATHLHIDVKKIRFLFVVLGLAAGLGLFVYVFLWITVPAGDGEQLAREADPNARLAQPLNIDDPRDRSFTAEFAQTLGKLPLRDIALGIILVATAAVMVATRFGHELQWSWVFSALVIVAGFLLAWGQLDSAQRGTLLNAGSARTPTSILRLAGGLAFVVVGVLLLVGQDFGVLVLWQALIAVVAVLIGVAFVLAPWWLRLVNQLGEERAATVRAKERADIAAHLHDSVLQTLALIQRSADQPGEVTRLARNQERELRAWLYNERSEPGTSVADQARETVALVENSMVQALGGEETVSIELVVVGDAEPNPDTDALLAAMSEALKNAVRHGKPPVSAYFEVRDSAYEVFVTDRGEGFDLDEVAHDRFGVRESIVGRIERRGGTATYRRLAVGGTEVALRIPRSA